MKSLNIIYKTQTLIILSLFVLINSGCKKSIQIPNARNQITTSAVFADSSDATAAVLGMYIIITQNPANPVFLYGGITIPTGLASDEISPTGGNQDDLQFFTNAVSPLNNSYNGASWLGGYKLIYQANACIEGLTASTGISISCKNQLMGESKLIRALCYFNLVNLFGDVPLATSTNYQLNASMPRTPKDSVYQLIIKDLVDAQQLLLVNYPSSGRVRPNRYTAMALLSRVYLYLQQWANAENIASQIISSGNYNLVTDLNKVFLAGSQEAIWQLIPVVKTVETLEGYIFIPSAGNKPRYSVSNFLLNSFETSDLRKANWLKSTVVNNVTYYYPFKYKLGADNNTTPLEDYMIFRLAEQFLIRAEARAQQGNISGALADLNIIRNRAVLANYNGATDQTSVIAAIMHERQVEFFCEFGHRWYDLKRTGQVNSVMSVVTPTKGGSWSTNWQLFPVPFSEIKVNPFLIQNPGY